MDAQAWNERYSSIDIVWGVAPNQFVAREAAALPAGRALDIACGEGRNAIWLAQRGWEVTAADFAAVAIDKGRKLAAAEGVDIDWRVEDVVQWSPPRRAFDLVLIAYLQLPARERAVAFERAASAVAPGGTFLYIAHDARNIADGYGGPQTPEVLCRADDVVAFLDGFTIASAGEVLRTVTLPDGSTTDAIDTLVRATRSER
jgi:SAM-dependent methyltransferase